MLDTKLAKPCQIMSDHVSNRQHRNRRVSHTESLAIDCHIYPYIAISVPETFRPITEKDAQLLLYRPSEQPDQIKFALTLTPFAASFVGGNPNASCVLNEDEKTSKGAAAKQNKWLGNKNFTRRKRIARPVPYPICAEQCAKLHVCVFVASWIS